MSSFLGIDPGANGAICILDKHGVDTFKLSDATEKDVWLWISSLPGNTLAVIEKVSGYVGEAQPGSSAFKFGANYGMLRAFLIAAGISFEEVTPQKWMKGMGLGTRGKTETKTAWKNKLKGKAQQIYPSEKVILATADALLIATYCKRKHEGKLG